MKSPSRVDDDRRIELAYLACDIGTECGRDKSLRWPLFAAGWHACATDRREPATGEPGPAGTRQEASATPAVQWLTDEHAWLIEHRPSPGITLWWDGTFKRLNSRRWANMVNDAGGAARFATRESAQKVLDSLLAMRPLCVFANAPSTYLVTEHLWPARSAPEQAAQPPELAAEPPELTTGAARPIFDQLAEMGRNFAEQAAQQADAAPRKSLSASVADALRPFLLGDQKVIWREPFRWFDDSGVMSNHYDGMSLDYLATEFGYEVIHDCGCAGVIRAASKKEG